MKFTTAQRRALLAQAEKAGFADMVRDDQDLAAIQDGCYFDPKFADHAVNFIEKGLIHATGRWAGQPFILTDWQRDRLVRPLFGWRRPDGSRRFRSAFVFVAKKNGKSTLVGAVMLYQLVAEPDPDQLNRTEQAAEIYAASTSREIASIVFREASKLAKRSPLLRRRTRTLDHTKRIIYSATNSFIHVLPHKADSAEGMIAAGVYLDEIHAMKNRALYATLRWSGASRRQPLVFEITTAGVDRPSLWKDRYNYSVRVRDGEHKDWSHLVLIYEADRDAEIDDPAQHAKANPSLGITIDADTLMNEAKQALAEGDVAVAEFKRYRLNIPVGQETAWIAPEVWDKGQSPFNLLELAEQPCLAGLDLAKVSDFSSLCLLWPPTPNELADPLAWWYAAWWFWIPRAEVMRRIAAGDLSYQAWADDGLIEITEGDTTDHNLIRKRTNEICGRFVVRKIGIDRGFEGWQFTQDLFNDDELPAVGIGQGWRSQDVPMTRIETIVRRARLNGGGNSLMRWMIGNAVAKRIGTNGNYHLDRTDRESKVDGVAALINAMYLAEAAEDDDAPEEYSTCPLV